MATDEWGTEGWGGDRDEQMERQGPRWDMFWFERLRDVLERSGDCLLYTSPSPRD